MASGVCSLPYIYLDPSKRLVSLIDLYDIQDGVPYDWSALIDKAIAHDDLRPLVTAIGLLRDKHQIVSHPRNFSKWTREFVCPTCTQFRLVFKCSKPQNGIVSNYWLLIIQQPKHSPECPTSGSIDHVSTLANLPSLIRQMRSVELEPQSAGRSFGFVDVMSNLQSQQLSTALKKSSIHRTLEQMRARHQSEVRDSYSLLPQFLRQYSDLNPEAVVALQVDDQDCS
jgi:hypothetical protein